MQKLFIFILAFLYFVKLNAFKINEELLPNADFKINKNGFPASWRAQYNKFASYKLVNDISFKGGLTVLVIDNPCKNKSASIRCSNISIPEVGKLQASVWAKGKGFITIFLIRSDWKGKILKKIFPIDKTWRKYSCNVNIPDHPVNKNFFFRIDCSGIGKTSIAEPSLQIVSLKKDAHDTHYIGSPCENLVINPEFELGWTGWRVRYFENTDVNSAVCQLRSLSPQIRPGMGWDGSYALYMPPGNTVESLPMPLIPGKTYTISAMIKADKTSKVEIFILDYKWRRKKSIWKVTNKWKRYFFSFKWDQPCFFKEVYIRFDSPKDSGILIDNIQFAKGKRDCYNGPKVTIGIISKLNIFNKNEQTNLILKAVPSKQLKKAYNILLQVYNFNGIVVTNRKYNAIPGKVFEKKLNLPTEKYGLYIIKLKAVDSKGQIIGIGLGRYAVIYKLPNNFEKGYNMGINVRPYIYPFKYYLSTLPVWKRCGVASVLVGFPRKYSDVYNTQEFVSLFKRTLTYFKKSRCRIIMRILMPRSIKRFTFFSNFPSGNNLWSQYVSKIIKTYSDFSSCFAFMGEINIMRMKKTHYKYKEFKKVIFPPLGTPFMPPAKAFRYYKTAYETAKRINPSLTICGPSINGEDFPYIKSFMAEGASKFMDVFGMDAYRAGPDSPEAYDDYIKLRHILDNNGFYGPIINLEQYLGICVRGYAGSQGRNRHYYTPWNKEKRYAGIIARNYIQHAAARILWFNYRPDMSLYDPFFLEGGFPSMAAPACAAATLFLNKSGYGVKISKTNSLKVFVFPYADKGPLCVIYTPLRDACGSIKIHKIKQAFDIMGNEFTKSQIVHGLPVSECPIYLKFFDNISLEDIKNLFKNADIKGIGEPFLITPVILSNQQLAIDITNNTNKSLTGKCKLQQLPPDWKAFIRECKFENLKSGEKRRLIFSMRKMPLNNLAKYLLSISVNAGDYFTGCQKIVSPMFAEYIPNINIHELTLQVDDKDWVSISSSNNLVYSDEKKKDKTLKARLACAWNKKGFILNVIVNDNDYIPPSQSESLMYTADSIQIYFDQQHNAKPNIPAYDNDDVVYQIGSLNGIPVAYLEHGQEGRYLGAANTMQGIDKDVKVNIFYSSGKIFYRVFFPWHTLMYIKPVSGEVIGFSILIHDKDKDGVCGISLDSVSPYKKPFIWKDLIFKKKRFNKMRKLNYEDTK